MIPAFEDSGFLPPFLESATATEGRSPYATTVREIVERFGRTRPRRALLRGFLNYRRHLWEFGVRDGIQWIGAAEYQEVIDGLAR